jgi:hypothetical protein
MEFRRDRCRAIQARKLDRNRPVQAFDLAFQTVGVTGFTLNPALRSYLLERHEATEHDKPLLPARPTSLSRPRRHRLRDRLSEQDLSAIIASFKTGTPAHVLAKRYGVGETALKSSLCGTIARTVTHNS